MTDNFPTVETGRCFSDTLYARLCLIELLAFFFQLFFHFSLKNAHNQEISVTNRKISISFSLLHNLAISYARTQCAASAGAQRLWNRSGWAAWRLETEVQLGEGARLGAKQVGKLEWGRERFLHSRNVTQHVCQVTKWQWPNYTSSKLFKNRFETFSHPAQQVFNILSQMPRIEFVNLSLNRLQTPILEPPPCRMTNLRSLVLNNTKLNWFAVEELLKLLPSLEELHLSLNEYTHVLLDTIDDDDHGNNNCKPSTMPSDECSCDDETPSSLGSEGEYHVWKQLT